LIVDVVFYGDPRMIKIPNICCKCAKLFPYEYLEVRVADYQGTLNSTLVDWIFRFPYCQICARELKKRLLFKGNAKGVSVHKAWVRTKKIGSFLRKKKIKYIPFKFTNEIYGQLFKEANKEMLLEKALAELE